ncbi:hypothetical protein HY970_01555 [Candidatus Kaiserbacteria bacterium]|nr:hypothetical protein [Candidatus Kaiserbacteria bacterium]
MGDLMRELLIATTNTGKLAEIVTAFVGLPFTFLTLYGPIFFNEEAGAMHSEESVEQRSRTSHRGKALKKMREILLKEFV